MSDPVHGLHSDKLGRSQATTVLYCTLLVSAAWYVLQRHGAENSSEMECCFKIEQSNMSCVRGEERRNMSCVRGKRGS
jgi:hypothetical protein